MLTCLYSIPASSNHTAGSTSIGAGAVVERLPLSVVKPMPASASLIEYGSSFNAFTLRKVSSYYLTTHNTAWYIPALVNLALLVRQHVGLTLEELGAFKAVILPQAGQIFYRLRILELCKVLLVLQVGVDLVEIARVAACLLLGILSSDGRHCGAWVSVQTVSVDPRPSAVVVMAGGSAMGRWLVRLLRRPADAEEISRNVL